MLTLRIKLTEEKIEFRVTLFPQSENGNIALVPCVRRKGMASVENAFCITYFIDYLTVFYCYYVSGRGYRLYFFRLFYRTH